MHKSEVIDARRKYEQARVRHAIAESVDINSASPEALVEMDLEYRRANAALFDTRKAYEDAITSFLKEHHEAPRDCQAREVR